MTALPADLLEKLQREYIATFAEKEKALESAFNLKDWPNLLSQFHKLAGSGATYAMPEISELCGQVENYLLKNREPSMKLLADSIEVLKKIFSARKGGQVYPLKNDIVLKYFYLP